MKKLTLLLVAVISLVTTSFAQTPEITSWIVNSPQKILHDTSGAAVIADVEAVYYDNTYAYIKSSGVPSYYKFVNNNGNHNIAVDKHYVFKIPRTPQAAASPASNLNGGQCGVIIDGSTFFNPEDARSYQNANIWHQLAYYFEGMDFDSTYGHSSPQNEYHHHVIDLAYIDTSKHNQHSPIIGFAFDGYPVYGPYGYSDPNDASSAIVRMTPTWQTRAISQRTTLPDGTILQAAQYGPAIGGQYPLGCYREDYEYVPGTGNLDTHNGRFGKTPEYPNGIYAYFATIDSLNRPRYPEFVGQTFYGVIAAGNMGPTGGQNTIPGSATLYVKATAINEVKAVAFSIYPNPTQNILTVKTDGASTYSIDMTDLNGQVLVHQNLTNASEQINVSALSAGIYLLTITDAVTGNKSVSRCVKL